MPDYVVLAETKLDEAFPNSQFTTDQYEIQTWRDINENVGGWYNMLEQVLSANPWKIFM